MRVNIKGSEHAESLFSKLENYSEPIPCRSTYELLLTQNIASKITKSGNEIEEEEREKTKYLRKLCRMPFFERKFHFAKATKKIGK